jgi:probable rRNA maturation factor
MIVVKNTQRSYPIDKKKLEIDIAQVLGAVGYSGYDVTVWFTTNATIKKYNKQFRGKDKSTDVISFPYYEIKKPGVLPRHSMQEPVLGDIMLSPEYIVHHLSEYGQTLEERILILVVHSICHLLGYDHEYDNDYAVMSAEEQRLMNILNENVY